MWARFVTLLGVVAIFGIGNTAFAQSAAAGPCTLTNGAAYLKGHDKTKTSVVVFVHGVMSNAVDAWSYDRSTSWPCLMLGAPVVGPTSNIYVHAYRTGFLGTNPSIEQVAAQLLKDLDADDVLKGHAHITIIAHSMGGLVVSNMLLQMWHSSKYKSHVDRVKLVQFYGTPATGAEIAKVASLFSNSVQFEEMRKQEIKQALVEKWVATKWPFRWHCVAEGKPTGGWFGGFITFFGYLSTQIVEPESAAALCRDRPQNFHTLLGFDHMSMVKPDSVSSEPYRYVFRNFKSCVAKSIIRPTPSNEAGTPNGQMFLRMLSLLRVRFIDGSDPGQADVQQAIEEVLFKSNWNDQYFLPKRMGVASMVDMDYENLPSRIFANEFVRFFRPRAASVKPSWISRISSLETFVPDGNLVELRSKWIASGQLQNSDYAVALDMPDVDGQVLVVGGIQKDEATGSLQARIRGFLLLPVEPQTCD